MLQLIHPGPNQTVVRVGNVSLFYSYDTLVAYDDGISSYRTTKKWSRTTSRHIKQWLGSEPALEASQERLEQQAELALIANLTR